MGLIGVGIIEGGIAPGLIWNLSIVTCSAAFRDINIP